MDTSKITHDKEIWGVFVSSKQCMTYVAVVLYTINYAVQSYSSIQLDEAAMTFPLLWVLSLPQVLCRHYRHYRHCIVPCYNGTSTGLYQVEMTPICCELHHFLMYYLDISDHSGYNSGLIKRLCAGWQGFPAWNGLQLGVTLFGKIVHIKQESSKWTLFHFLTMRWCRLLKFFLMNERGLFIPQRQYHGCWWLGDTRNQVMSSYGIDPVLLEYLYLCTRIFKNTLWHLLNNVIASHLAIVIASLGWEFGGHLLGIRALPRQFGSNQWHKLKQQQLFLACDIIRSSLC